MVCQQILNKVQNRSHLGGDDYVMGTINVEWDRALFVYIGFLKSIASPRV